MIKIKPGLKPRDIQGCTSSQWAKTAGAKGMGTVRCQDSRCGLSPLHMMLGRNHRAQGENRRKTSFLHCLWPVKGRSAAHNASTGND
ncbi:MAG: hypothetical protein A3E79_12720 [Burkholderiales bacterium RIFCSPHIGHO2_12_FULL_61_11]|nr:MAG: hypothetical protein A3E79_12720 [Burkholderiales bacterium RIFCSPHIGHO2_12_FULL_61_11]